MFSSLRLRARRGGGEQPPLPPLPPGPPHLDLTSTSPPRPRPQPVVTTTRRSHKWSIDKALCPGIGGDKREENKLKMPSKVEVNHKRQDNIENNNSFNHIHDWDTQSYEEEHSSGSGVQVVTRVMNVSIERDSSGSLGITLRGGAHPDPSLGRPLTITQVKPGGPADREGSIKVGDRLLSVDGRPLHSVSLPDAQNALRATAPLSLLCVEYDVSVMSGVRAARGPLLVEIEGAQARSLGLELVDTPDHSAVLIGHVKTGSIAERCGALLPGDQILSVNDICVEDTKMSSGDVNQLIWAGDSCVLQILPTSSSSYRGFPQPLYSCPSPSQSSKHSRELHRSGNTSPNNRLNSPSNRLKTSSVSIHESEVEANSSGVYQRKTLSISLKCDSQNRFGITLAPDNKGGTYISEIEPRSPAERCGSLQTGDRVLELNDNAVPCLSGPQTLEALCAGLAEVTLGIEYSVASAVMPTSGVFTVRLANNKVAGLGITISGSSQRLVISHVRPGSVAHRCGSLSPGDRLLSVNGHGLAGCSSEQAGAVLHSPHDIVTLVVQKGIDEIGEEAEQFDSVHTVELCRGGGGGGPLGITIAGSEDPSEPILVSALTPDGLAERSGVLRIGDRLLAIDSHSLGREPLSTAISLLQRSSDRVVLCVGRTSPSPMSVSGAREDGMGYSSPELPSVDSAVESWDSLHEQSPPAPPPHHPTSKHFYKSESATVKRKQPLQSCDSPLLNCNSPWGRGDTGGHSMHSLTTVQSDADDTCSSFRLSESVLNEYTKGCAPPSAPCPLQVNYQLRNNTLPDHRRTSTIGAMRYHECVEADLMSSPHRCRRGFHLLEDEAVNLPLSEDLEVTHPEITFDTFFKRVIGGPNRELADHKSDRNIFQVTLFKDPVYEDFGFSVSDGLYERGVFVNRIRRGGPADLSRMLQPYDCILQVNETKTEELDCCLTVPLVAAAGDKLQLTISRGGYGEIKDNDHITSDLPWMDEDKESETQMQIVTPTITKTL